MTRAEQLAKMHVSLAADVKERIVKDSEEQGVSLNDVTVGILAEHFRVRFEGTSRKSPGAKTPAGAVLLTMPQALQKKIHVAAFGSSKVTVVNSILREHYARSGASVAAA